MSQCLKTWYNYMNQILMKNSRKFMKILRNSVKIMDKLSTLKFQGLLKILQWQVWVKFLFNLQLQRRPRSVRSRFRDSLLLVRVLRLAFFVIKSFSMVILKNDYLCYYLLFLLLYIIIFIYFIIIINIILFIIFIVH